LARHPREAAVYALTLWPGRDGDRYPARVPDKPSYLGLLNAIALAESRAHCYLTAWINTTPSDDVRAVLSTVAAREGEHGMSFAKRIDELGYCVLEREDPGFAEKLEIAGSDRSDLEKMRLLDLGRPERDGEPDIFDGFFGDHSIDIATGELLGRYIAEERDSGRRLRECRQLLEAQANGAATSGDGGRLASVERKLDELCSAVEELRSAVCATPASTTAAPRGRRAAVSN